MPIPHFEVLAGVIDGVNTVFTASVAYQAGSTAVFINGQLKRPTQPGIVDGWVETSPALGVVTLDEAPLADPDCGDDVVQMFFLDTTPPAIIVEAGPEPLSATIQDVAKLDASIETAVELDGIISSTATVDATIDDVEQLVGSIENVVGLDAVMEACP